MCYNNYILILIILLCAILGGTINFLTSIETRKSEENTEKSERIQFLLQILLGICGSSLIPLLLHLTSSKLFSDCNSNFPYFVFAGYCLIGAVFSRSLLNGLAKRLDLERVEKKLETVDQKVKEAGELFLEGEKQDPVSDISKVREARLNTILSKVDNQTSHFLFKDSGTSSSLQTEQILDIIQNSTRKNHSVSTIAKETGFDENKVSKIMKALEDEGLLIERKWYGNYFYSLTDKGRETRIVN